jgi:hypothetical protein
MTNSDSRSSFSGYGTCVNIFAPGSSIKVRAVAGWSLVIPWIFPGCSLGILAEVLLVVLLELVTPGGPNLVKTVEMMQRKEREEIYCRNPVLLTLKIPGCSKFRAHPAACGNLASVSKPWAAPVIPLPVVIWLAHRTPDLPQALFFGFSKWHAVDELTVAEALMQSAWMFTGYSLVFHWMFTG